MKKGFTLAEVLITLGIIGIVAAMTMPTLIQKHQEKVTVTQLKKTYSILSQALNLAVSEYGTVDNWDTYSYEADGDGILNTDKEGVIHRYTVTNLIKHLKLSKDCGYKSEGCFTDNGYKRLNGDTERNFELLNNQYYKAILSDGVSIAIEGYPPDVNSSEDRTYGEIWVDINGPQKPNVVGKDLFLFGYTNKRILSYQSSLNNVPLSSTTCKLNSSGYACANWVLYAGNLDYLHCNDLSYVGKTKCK